MTYVNTYTGEEHEERCDCRDDIITMQESGKSELMDFLEWAVHDKGEDDKDYAVMLRAGLDFIKDCVQFAEANMEFGYDLDETFIDPYIKEVE